MRSRLFKAFATWLTVASLGMLACDLSTLGLAQATKPQVTITAPTAGSQFRDGDTVSVTSTSTDSAGIVRVELAVDGATVRTDTPPVLQGQKSFPVIQTWKATAGVHTLSVRAYNAANAASDPAIVSITVTPAAAEPTVVPTLAVGIPPLGTLPTLAPAEPTSNATATKRPPTKVPATPTINAPPGVWATAIRVDPTAPKRGQGVKFIVSFLNTTGTQQGFRWRVRIFEPDKRNSFGDTTPLDSSIPPGASELVSSDNWKVTGPGDCLAFFARVFQVDPNSKQESEFIKPDQSGGPAAGFQVCP